MATAAGDEFCIWLGSELVHRHQEEDDTVGKLIVTEMVTLDGVAQAPSGPTRTATAASCTGMAGAAVRRAVG
jgi:hypothetical protein